MNWPMTVLSGAASFVFFFLVTYLLAAMQATRSLPRRITPRGAQELGDELEAIVRAGGMTAEQAWQHWDHALGCWRVMPLYPDSPVRRFSHAEYGFRADLWDRDYPDWPQFNVWRD